MTGGLAPTLLAIIELGGYPNFAPLYQRLGFSVQHVNSQRKARAWLKHNCPAVIVAEYNFQSDFRDRSSNLETLMAWLQRNPETRLVVFYPPEHRDRLQQLRERFEVFEAMPLPVDAALLERALLRALSG